MSLPPEFLPYTISSTEIGGHYGATGPYMHFSELGLVTRNANETCYRVACVGFSTRSNQQKPLLLEFNQNSVNIKDLAWPSHCTSGLGFLSSYSFVGACAYSMPTATIGTSGRIQDKTQMAERAYLGLLSSNGSLLTFGEDGRGSTRSAYPHVKKREDIFCFEDLANVGDMDSLVLGGDAVGKNPAEAKRKLSLNNTNEYLISPSYNGCTITAGFRHLSVPEAKKGETDGLAISAVRVLVGSVAELIPREISLMGRSIKPKKNQKRWYDFVLTDEEILIAMRNGFVTISISGCFETSNSPIVDAIEIYVSSSDETLSRPFPFSLLISVLPLPRKARMKNDLPFLRPSDDTKRLTIPKFSYTLRARTYEAGMCTIHRRNYVDFDSSHYYLINFQPKESIRSSSMKMLTNLVQLVADQRVGQSLLTDGQRCTIGQVIQETVLDSNNSALTSLRSQAIEFLHGAETEADATRLADEAIIKGVMTVLAGLEKFLRSEDVISDDELSARQEATIKRAVDVLPYILLLASQIAKRGKNYAAIILKLIGENENKLSVAGEAQKVITLANQLRSEHGIKLSLVMPTKCISELILTEIAYSSDSDSIVKYAKFDSLTDYLLSDTDEIVTACCESVLSLMAGSKKEETAALASNSSVPGAPSPGEGYVTYQCDSCKVFPIRGTRYTLDDGLDIDLCKKCYDMGVAHADQAASDDDPLVISGNTLSVEGEDMTCAMISQMRPVSIASSSLEQAEKAGYLLKSGGNSIPNPNPPSRDISADAIQSESFRSQIFGGILELMANRLKVTNSSQWTAAPSIKVLQLVLSLALNSSGAKKVARGKQAVLAFTQNIPDLVKALKSSSATFDLNCSRLVLSLQTLASLVLQKTVIENHADADEVPYEDQNNNLSTETKASRKPKTDPR